jgi:hypothetical protein
MAMRTTFGFMKRHMLTGGLCKALGKAQGKALGKALAHGAAVSLALMAQAIPSSADVPASPITLSLPAAGVYDQFADVVALPGGGFLMAHSRVGPGVNSSLIARVFKADGKAAKAAVVIESARPAGGVRPRMVLAGANTVAIVWQTGDGVYGGLFNFTASSMGPVTRLAEADDLIHDIVRLSDGKFAMVSVVNDVSNPFAIREKVSLTLMNAAMGKVAGPLSAHGTGHALDPWNMFDHTIINAGNGGYVFLRDRSNGKLMMRRFSASGAFLGTLSQVNTKAMIFGTLIDQVRFEVKAKRLVSGHIVVVWTSKENTNGNGEEVRMRIMSPAGTWLGPDQRVNVATAGAQAYPEIVPLSSSTFGVLWVNDATIVDRRYLMRKFNATGTPIGTVFQSEAGTSFALGADTVATRQSDGSIVHVLSGFIGLGTAPRVKAEGFRP